MKPFFSVVIPTLNEENFLPKLLNDLTKQKKKNFEVIIVDGGSKDKTKEVAEKFSNTLSIIFFQSNKKNVSYQRNLGAARAQGKYLLFLDADTRIPLSLTKNVHRIIEKEKGLLFIPYFMPDKNNIQTDFIFTLSNILAESSQLIGKPFSLGGNMIVEKNFFYLLGGFPEDVYIAEDHGLVQKAYQWGVKAKFLRKIKTKVNLRRAKREGVKLWYKNIVAIAHILLKGKIERKIFDYEMGGHLYLNKEKKETPEELLKKYLKQAKDFFDQLF